MTGALACLQDWLQHPLDDADLIVGTSAGSVLAAALRCGATVEEMAAWQRGDAAGILGESAALAPQDGPFPPLPRLRFGSAPWLPRRCCGQTWFHRGWARPHGSRMAADSTPRCEPWSPGCTGVTASTPARVPRRCPGPTVARGSPPRTTTPGNGSCSGGRAPRRRRSLMRWSRPAPFPAGTSRERSAAAVMSTAGSGARPHSAPWLCEPGEETL